jgi:hypothetical protein
MCVLDAIVDRRGIVKPELIDSLLSEANELTAIVVASMKTAKCSR